MQIEVDFWRSLNDSDLVACLASRPKHEQVAILQQLMDGSSGHETDLARKRDKRSKAAEVFIPPVVDADRRNKCLADPERFLREYGRRVFYNPFALHHKRMIAAIYERAKTGGDKAVAAPRGDGKTQVATWMIVYILLAAMVRFPIIVAATGKHARKIFKQIKGIFANYELAEDFPEISACVRALDGAPQRAAKQHVGGVPTNIVWTKEELGLPHVAGSPYGGRYLAYFGLDSAIRGVHNDAVRPDFALIDDPETRIVARSETQHYEIEALIDGDIAGLADPSTRMSRVVLTTIQNRRCYSFRVTDPKIKPTFAGERYGMFSERPDDIDKWIEYVALRQQSQATGDKDGWAATELYLANREAMDAGFVVTNPNRYVNKEDESGRPIEVSAIQNYFNRVADWGWARVKAELDNDPEEEETEETLGLTAGIVATRISGLAQNELPKAEPITLTTAIDLGKYWSHWVKIAWSGNATGCIIDYGIMETPGVSTTSTEAAIEQAVLKALHQWRTEVLASNPPAFCLIDSGDMSSVVYEFVRQVGGSPFAASKGASKFQQRADTEERRTFNECWAGRLPKERLWLYNVNTEFWKHWVHQRFSTPTLNDQNQLNDGTLSLFASEDRKKHHTFSHHIVSEEMQERFMEGKGLVRKWVPVSKNNHWLDATALACCAAGVLGIQLIPRSQPVHVASRGGSGGKKLEAAAAFRQTPYGQPFLITERK